MLEALISTFAQIEDPRSLTRRRSGRRGYDRPGCDRRLVRPWLPPTVGSGRIRRDIRETSRRRPARCVSGIGQENRRRVTTGATTAPQCK